MGIWGYQKINVLLVKPVHVKDDQLLTIERGTNGSKLAALLERENLVKDAQLLPWLLKFHPQLNKIKAGV